MGVQRQLKVLGIFARLEHRDGKQGYLEDMPRVVATCAAPARRYSELGPLLRAARRHRREAGAARSGYTLLMARPRHRDDPRRRPRRADAAAHRHLPKPLLPAGGKPLIVWQIEALRAPGTATS